MINGAAIRLISQISNFLLHGMFKRSPSETVNNTPGQSASEILLPSEQENHGTSQRETSVEITISGVTRDPFVNVCGLRSKLLSPECEYIHIK